MWGIFIVTAEQVKELALGPKAFHLCVTNSNPALVNSRYKSTSSNEFSEQGIIQWPSFTA